MAAPSGRMIMMKSVRCLMQVGPSVRASLYNNTTLRRCNTALRQLSVLSVDQGCGSGPFKAAAGHSVILGSPCSLVGSVRQLSVSSAAQGSLEAAPGPRSSGGSTAADGSGSPRSPWTLLGSVCLQRLPVISRDMNPLEETFAQLMHQMELEKSLLSDHELRLLDDAERLRRKQSDDYDSDDEAEGGRRGDDEIVLAQDLEDAWESRMKQFNPSPRITDAMEHQMSSLQRCLADPLVLLVQQKVGDQDHWMLPQTIWQEGETLRQTAERALTDTLPEAASQATFLGSTPCGFYKYKVPVAARTETSVGAKVFFFKAVLSVGADLSQVSQTPRPFMWVKKSELQDHLNAAYLDKVKRFILDI